MPYKNGGGNKPELYDEDTGEYTEEEKAYQNKKRLQKLVFTYYFGENEDVAFPDYRVNDREYCDLYIDYIKKTNFQKTIDRSKLNYFFRYQKDRDKSKFLIELGYDENSLEADILKNTRFEGMMFDHLDQYGLTVIACTKLISKTTFKEYLITSVWQFTSSKKAKLITIYPGGKFLWNSIYSKK